jgi:hypothetical protein
MLQAHSILWHYLWLAPDVIQVLLAILIYRRGLHKLFPVFFVYLIYEAIETFALYAMDVLPFVSAQAYWKTFWVVLIVGGLLKFAVIGELLRHVLHSWPALARTGGHLLTLAGAILTLGAAVAAAYTTPDNPHWLVGGSHVLQQTFYIVQCGLILFLFAFAAHFKVAWDRSSFGIALGFAILFCQHLASWAVIAGIALPSKSALLTFLNMATYHVCVLIWCYYLLVPQTVATTSAVSLPENDLAMWNREVERLLQQ